jgi:uncharacterized membrane protein YjfL (UPF0719 family)
MFSSRLLVSFFELLLMIFVSGVIVFVIYQVFVKSNPDFDMEEEIKNGNIAVGIVVGAMMVSGALLLQKGLEASVAAFRLAVASPLEAALPLWQAGLLIVGHLSLTLSIAVLSISVALREFGRMARRFNAEMHLGRHLKDGNIAVGIMLAAVIFIVTLYVGAGVSALTKALVPQPRIGKIQIMD